jgi:hypothetical protein
MTRYVETENFLPPPPLTSGIPLAFAFAFAAAASGGSAARVTTAARSVVLACSCFCLSNARSAAPSQVHYLIFSFTFALHFNDEALSATAARPISRRCCVVLQIIGVATLAFPYDGFIVCLSCLGCAVLDFSGFRLACLPAVEGALSFPVHGTAFGVFFLSFLGIAWSLVWLALEKAGMSLAGLGGAACGLAGESCRVTEFGTAGPGQV